MTDISTYVNEFVSDSEKAKLSFSRKLTEWMLDKCSAIPYVQARTDLLNGIIDPLKYHYLLNPYNVKDPRLKNFPGELRNWDIIRPIWRRYLGEFMVDVRNFDVVNAMTNHSTIRNEKEKKAATEAMFILFSKRMAEEGIIVEDPNKDFIDIPTYIEKQLSQSNSNQDDTVLTND